MKKTVLGLCMTAVLSLSAVSVFAVNEDSADLTVLSVEETAEVNEAIEEETAEDELAEEATEADKSAEEATEADESAEEATEADESTEETTEADESATEADESATEADESAEEATEADGSAEEIADTDESAEEVSDDTDAEESAAEINEDVFVEINGEMYFPVREVFEGLGYNVEWHGDTKMVVVEKLPQYVTFIIDVDGYTFARTAPNRLGAAPVIIDERAYAPITLLTEILGMNL